MTTTATTITILDLPTTVCVNVFNYLDSDDFVTVSTLVKCWYAERFIDHPGIRHDIVPTIELRPKKKKSSSLSQSDIDDDGDKDGVVVGDETGAIVAGSGSTINFFKNLHRYQKNPVTNDKLQNRYQNFRVFDIHKFDESIRPNEIDKMVDTTITTTTEKSMNNSHSTAITDYHLEPLEGIESLNLSVSSSVVECGATRMISMKVCGFSLPYGLSRILPNLLELNLSNGDYCGSTLRSFTEHCPLLEKIIWNNIRNTYIELDGYNMRNGRNVKELVLDDSTFSPILHEQLSDLNHPTYLFQEIAYKLERVSILNAKLRNCGVRTVPQSALMKFVRNGPSSLKWFRSDLTPTNIDILKRERPDIEFAQD